MLMAGLDGIENGIEPPDPVDVDIYELSAEEAAGIASVPHRLEESLIALERDHDYLLQGGVFTEDLLTRYFDDKMDEARDIDSRPTPAEFHHYFHI